MKTWSEATMEPLEEVIESHQIFASMVSLNVSFIPDASVAEYLDLEYFYNRSGRKVAAPLVARMSDENNFVAKLAKIIVNRFGVKWEQYFDRYSDLATLNLLNNINVKTETAYASGLTRSGSDTLTKDGSETETIKMTETHTEAYDALNPRKSSRAITGAYTDTTNSVSTRTGTEEILETFPQDRKSTKNTTGGYADADTITSTRTGSQKVTEKGDTSTSTFGFNSSTAVPASLTGPADSTNGLSTETTYGNNGLIDAHSGSITRTYNQFKEETTESGSKKTATTFGQDGLADTTAGGTTRTYNNYKDEVTETGSKTTSVSYGNDGRTKVTAYDERSDSRTTSSSESHTGKDTVTESGYRYRRDELVQEYLSLFSSDKMIDFLEIVYSDVDSVLTCPIFM